MLGHTPGRATKTSAVTESVMYNHYDMARRQQHDPLRRSRCCEISHCMTEICLVTITEAGYDDDGMRHAQSQRVLMAVLSFKYQLMELGGATLSVIQKTLAL